MPRGTQRRVRCGGGIQPDGAAFKDRCIVDFWIVVVDQRSQLVFDLSLWEFLKCLKKKKLLLLLTVFFFFN